MKILTVAALLVLTTASACAPSLTPAGARVPYVDDARTLEGCTLVRSWPSEMWHRNDVIAQNKTAELPETDAGGVRFAAMVALMPAAFLCPPR